VQVEIAECHRALPVNSSAIAFELVRSGATRVAITRSTAATTIAD